MKKVFLCIIIISISTILIIKYGKENKKVKQIDKHDNSILMYEENTKNSSTLPNETIPVENINIHEGNMQKNKIKKGERTTEKIKMIIDENTLTNQGVKIIIQDDNENPYTYDEWFEIEKENSGKWEKVGVVNEKYTLTGLAFNIKENGKIEQNINWNSKYGELESGKYKLIKKVYESGEEQYFSVEFIIN